MRDRPPVRAWGLGGRQVRTEQPKWGNISTMLGILGRMASYTGLAITWNQAINSPLRLAPKEYSWDAEPPVMPDAEGRYPVAMPGITRFV